MVGWQRVLRLRRNLLSKARVEQELDEELRAYVELLTAEKVSGGMDEAAARRAALLEVGGVEQVKEAVREVRAGAVLETILQDTRYGLRALTKNRAFTLAAVLTLALGIGATTAIFSIIHAVVLRPLPFADPDRLVILWPVKQKTSSSKADYVELKKEARSFDDIAAYSGWGFTVTGGGEPVKLDGARASSNLFSVLGVGAARGRTFLPSEEQPGGDKVAVLSHGLWQSRFGADETIVGQRIAINGEDHTVVGVMPRGFNFPVGVSRDLWVPATLDPAKEDDYGAAYLTLIGRLKRGVSANEAQAEIASLSGLAGRRKPGAANDHGRDAKVNSLQAETAANARPTLLILLGAVGLVLLIACANVANLQLARTAGRQKEFAIRAALGARRARLVRQLLTESLLLSVLGGAAGLVVAYWGLDLLLALFPADTPRLNEVAISRQVLGFALGVSLAAGAIFGLAPALQAAAPNLEPFLREGGRGSAGGAGGRLRSLLVVSEVALALMLIVSAGLMIKSFWRLQQVDPGFEVGNVLSFQLSPPPFAPPGSPEGPARARVYYRQALERLATLPGVESVGGIHLLPMGDSNWNPGLRVEDRPAPAGAESGSVNWRLVTPDYFRTMNVPLLKGRAFNHADNERGAAVAIVNETLARKYWPGEDPLGRRISTGFEGKDKWATVVGVVGDVKQQGLGAQTEPEMYRPYEQHASLPPMTVMVRAAADPAALASSVRSAVWSVDKNVPVDDMQPMAEVVARSISRPRSTTLVLAAFAGVALALGVVGIYGVVSYAVTQRTQEIGVRIALGAREADVIKLVVGHGLRLVAAGIGIGLAGSLAVTHLMSGLLFGVTATDPATYVSVAALLTVVALLACYVPARRAAKVDPLVALRAE